MIDYRQSLYDKLKSGEAHDRKLQMVSTTKFFTDDVQFFFIIYLTCDYVCWVGSRPCFEKLNGWMVDLGAMVGILDPLLTCLVAL